MASRARVRGRAGGPLASAGTGSGSLAGLVVLLGTAGVAHLVRPSLFEGIVPRALGRPGPWVAASGAAELICAAALVPPATRRAAALATAGLFVAVYPANLVMAARAVRSRRASTGYRAAALLRLPLQLPLVLWALRQAGAAR